MLYLSTPRQIYIPKTAVDFAGSSQFGGQDNELVLCAGKGTTHSPASIPQCLHFLKDGGIHIWGRDSGVLLHYVTAQTTGDDLACITWNYASKEPLMFATGSYDGAVRIWTASKRWAPFRPSQMDEPASATSTIFPRQNEEVKRSANSDRPLAISIVRSNTS